MITSVLLAALAGQTVPTGWDVYGDLHFEFDRIQAEQCQTGPCKITIPPGEYLLSAPILINTQVHVEAYGARIVAAPDQGGIIFAQAAQNSSWRGGELQGDSRTNLISIGVHVETPVNLTDMRIHGFANGLQLGPDGFAANGTYTGLWINSNRLNGVLTLGSEANANHFLGLEVRVNCRGANAFVDLPNYEDPSAGGICANVADRSFLGNYWRLRSSQAQDFTTPETAGDRIVYWQIFASGAGSVFSDSYLEQIHGTDGNGDFVEGNGRVYLSGGSTLIGGMWNYEMVDIASVGAGNFINNHGEFRRLSTHVNGAELLLGTHDGRSSPFIMRWAEDSITKLFLHRSRPEKLEFRASDRGTDAIFELMIGEDSPAGYDRGTVIMKKVSYMAPCPTATAGLELTPFGCSGDIMMLRAGGRVAFCQQN